MKNLFFTLTILICANVHTGDISKKGTNKKPRNMHGKKACSNFKVPIKKSTKNALESQYAKISPEQAATFRQWDRLHVFGALLREESKKRNKGQE